jgi:integrase
VKLSTCEACTKKPKKDCPACNRQHFAHVSPNDLRRTFGHALRARGVEPQLIAPAMGHVDGQMVERVYGRLQPEELARLLETRLRGQPVASRVQKTRNRRAS